MALKRKPSQRSMLITGITLLVFGIVLSAFLVLRPKQYSAPLYSGPVEKINLGLVGEYGSLALIAENKGFFKAKGLNVTINLYPSGPPALDDLIAGKIDMTTAGDFAGVRSSLNGADFKILTTMTKSETFFLVGRKDHGINDVASLKTKKIGITKGTVGEFYLGQFLTFNNLAWNDVTVVNLTQAELSNALDKGQIDGAVLFEPSAYKTRAKLGLQAVQLSIQSKQDLVSLMYSNSKFTSIKAEATERFLSALVTAEDFIKTHNQEAKDIVGQWLGYDSDYMNYIWSKHRFEVSLEQELLINMDDQAQWAINNKLTSATKAPNYLKMIYFKGLESVRPDRVTIIH